MIISLNSVDPCSS